MVIENHIIPVIQLIEVVHDGHPIDSNQFLREVGIAVASELHRREHVLSSLSIN